MMITAYGFVLFLTAVVATVEQAGYPPFGLANVSFVGLSSFLILIGLYHSAISVANDVTLRKSIKNSALRESKLLDSIGTAQMTLEDTIFSNQIQPEAISDLADYFVRFKKS
ncbi:MAG: hypothetical protein WCF23_22305 [Candidatus Nitrosopolaris sp.]